MKKRFINIVNMRKVIFHNKKYGWVNGGII